MVVFRRSKSVMPLPKTFTIFDLKLIVFFIFSVVLVTSDQATDIYAAFNHFKGPSIYYVQYYVYLCDIVGGSEKV